MGTYTKNTPLQGLLLLLLSSFILPAHATVTFRIFTAGAQAGEIHIDSPEGSFVYFREDFDSSQPADGFCGIRWVGEVEDLVWYWGNPGWMSYLPGNGGQVEKLAYVTAYSTCFTKLNASFETPCTPDGIAPPDALMLVVEVPGEFRQSVGLPPVSAGADCFQRNHKYLPALSALLPDQLPEPARQSLSGPAFQWAYLSNPARHPARAGPGDGPDECDKRSLSTSGGLLPE